MPKRTIDLIDRFNLEYQVFNRISKKRTREQLALLRDLRSYVGHELDTLEPSEFQAWAANLMAVNGYHVNTVRKKMNMIRPFVSWMLASNIIDGGHYMRLKAVKNPRGATGRTKPKPYTQKEMVVFWETFEVKWPRLPTKGPGSRAISRYFKGQGKWRPVWRHAFRLQLLAMIRLALDLGLRAHEIQQMSVDDLHYDNEYLVIWGKADPNTGEKKVRTVPWTKESHRAVKEWLEFRARLNPDHNSPWLVLYAQWRLNPMDMKRFEVLLQKSLGEGWAWHRLRHTCATEWLRAGMALETVSRLLGHASTAQTLCYAEITKADLQLAVTKHEERFSGAVDRRPDPEDVQAAA